MDNVVMCISNSCPMAYKCHRHTEGDLDDPYQSWVNFEYACNETTGFSDFILCIENDIKL